jgi:selenocysteine-specific elongation factor
VVTAGHVDHGKSTLLQGITGMAPDRLAEERRRGMTIELGFVWTQLPATPATPSPARIAFVDVPGHERLVTTMLAGAGAAPAALLVVAADDGWAAQSTEHRDVLDLLQVPAVLRVVTKADAVREPTRVAEVVAEVEAATAGTSLAAAPIVVVDALTGRGMEHLRQELRDAIATLPAAIDHGRPRLWTDRVFDLPGAGTVVTGTLTGGRLAVGDRIELLPSGHSARIRRLHCLGDDVQEAGPGSRVAVNLAGVGHTDLPRGDALVAGGGWRTTTTIDAWIRTLPGSGLDRPGAWRLHVGATSTPVQVLPIAGPIPPRGSGAVRIELEHPLPVVAGDRLVLREVGRRATVAGGVIIDPAPLGRLRGTAARRTHATALAAASGASGPRARLRALVELAGGSRDHREARAAADIADGTPVPEDLLEVGDHLVLPDTLTRWREAVRALGPGVHDRPAVAAAARAAGAPASAAAGLADLLVRAGELVRTTDGLALPEHADAAAIAQRARADAVIAALLASPYAPPDLDALLRTHELDARERAGLVSRGQVVRCGPVAFAAQAIEQAVAHLRVLEAARGPFTASEAREALGTTRRYVIPLLEHLERTGRTRFDGQRHRFT